MKARPTTVIVNFNVRHKAARDMIAGIMRYAAGHPHWEILMRGNHPSNDGFVVDKSAKVDGMISGYDLNRTDEPGQENIQQLLSPRPALRAVTVISVPPYDRQGLPGARIDVDHAAIARCAAKAFLDNGLGHFAFIGGKADDDWSHARRTAFASALAPHGYAVDDFRSPAEGRIDWSAEKDALRTWLTALPKPCGVFAAFDQRARHVIDICRTADINIPREIQVIGVDNENTICELTVPTLSSIDPGFQQAGYRAARELDRLLHGGRPRKKSLVAGHPYLIERLSTSDITRNGERVSRALEFIRNHASEPIGVNDVCRAIGGSVRLLEKNFKTVRGRNICLEIQDCRLNAVAQQLRETSLPLSQIARQSGFRGEAYLKTLFKKRFGTTMRRYRLGVRAEPVRRT